MMGTVDAPLSSLMSKWWKRKGFYHDRVSWRAGCVMGNARCPVRLVLKSSCAWMCWLGWPESSDLTAEAGCALCPSYTWREQTWCTCTVSFDLHAQSRPSAFQ